MGKESAPQSHQDGEQYSVFRTAMDWLLPFDGINTFAKDHFPNIYRGVERVFRKVRREKKLGATALKGQIKRD